MSLKKHERCTERKIASSKAFSFYTDKLMSADLLKFQRGLESLLLNLISELLETQFYGLT